MRCQPGTHWDLPMAGPGCHQDKNYTPVAISAKAMFPGYRSEINDSTTGRRLIF